MMPPVGLSVMMPATAAAVMMANQTTTSPNSSMARSIAQPNSFRTGGTVLIAGLPPEARKGEAWRKGGDSNPRYGYPYAAFRVRCFQPLSHLSA